jgi:hypothetical protein
MFKMNEKTIKQIKRLQNRKIMNDKSIDMEDIKHQGEDKDMTTIENNPSKKGKKKRIKKMLKKTMTIHKLLAKTKIEIILEKNNNVVFSDTSKFRSNCDEQFKIQKLCNLYLIYETFNLDIHIFE